MTQERKNRNEVPSGAKRSGFARIVMRALFRVVLPLLVVAGGIAIAVRLIETAPHVDQQPAERRAALVEVEEIHFGQEQVTVEIMGTVRPAREISLMPRVTGQLIEVSPNLLPGGGFASGELMARIDPSDCELTVSQRESDLARAEANLRLEEGEQAVARQEVEMLGEVIDDDNLDLVLRGPQLATAQAQIATARAALAQARLDLQRTQIRAPFNAIVLSRHVELGSQVSPSTAIATLVGADEFWVEATVPVDRLQWIRIPRAIDEVGSTVRVYNEAAWGKGVYRTGQVIRLAADLEESGRMARLIISVPDPLSLGEENRGAPAMLLGSYVRAEIEGPEISGALVLDRGLLKDGDTVHIMGEDDTLEIRPVNIVHRGRSDVLITSGVAEGERLIVSNLSTPVEGMPLRLRESDLLIASDPTSAEVISR